MSSPSNYGPAFPLSAQPSMLLGRATHTHPRTPLALFLLCRRRMPITVYSSQRAMAAHTPCILFVLSSYCFCPISIRRQEEYSSKHRHLWRQLPWQASARQALARLARVHSSFTRPALAALWRFLSSDKALKHLLCVVGIAQRPPETRNNSWYRLCPVELYGTPETRESRWTRFQEYACLVREITIDPFVAAVDPNLRPKPQQDTFWYQLLSAFGNAPILPRLEVATLLNAGSFLTFRDSLDTGPLCLLNPVIRELNIIFPYLSGREDETTLRSVLSACFSSRQNVEVLSLELPVRALDIKSLPQSHPHLRHLELKLDYDYGPRIDPNHFTSLATLTTLESLSIGLSSQAPLNLPVTFTRLRNLAVSGYDFRAIGALIARVDAPQLRTFSITETHIYSNNIHQELPSYLRMLVAKCQSLMSFHWHSRQIYHPRHGFGGERRAGATLAELIDPLLSLRTIRSFSARFWSTIVPYSSTDFRTIAEAWPVLETFHLYDHEDSAGDQYADLESILSFARHCPHLRSLGIPKVMFDSDVFISQLVLPATPHWLRNLAAGCVVCSGEQDDEDHRRKGAEQLRSLMGKVFPSATIRIRRCDRNTL